VAEAKEGEGEGELQHANDGRIEQRKKDEDVYDEEDRQG
jgi:hypothetical protein